MVDDSRQYRSAAGEEQGGAAHRHLPVQYLSPMVPVCRAHEPFGTLNSGAYCTVPIPSVEGDVPCRI